MSDALRILMVVNTPWDRRLGAPRVQIELAEQFRALGHQVDAFTYPDAYASPARIPRLAGVVRSFPRRAARHIKKHGSRYDIVDARNGSLVATKQSMGFDGLFVTRSTGLLPIYEREFLNEDRRRGDSQGRLLLRPLQRFEVSQGQRRARLAFEHADLINVLNSDEEAFCGEQGLGGKTVKFLHGLTRERFDSFQAARRPYADRLRSRRVVFVGGWNRRKGSHDMGNVVRRVATLAPGVRFSFLGTGGSADAVGRDIGPTDAEIEVRPRFESDDLPGLLGDATVGILPSYVEGFPFSIIEMLGAGLPVVAYDAPGARETLPSLDNSWVVTRGDVEAFAQRIADTLLLDEGPYREASDAATRLGDGLRWEDIARATIDTYRERLEQLPGRATEARART